MSKGFMMKAFTVPKDGESYSTKIIERTEALISQNIWQGVDRLKFRLWLKNFKTNEEKYFAACVLDATIYRSKEQTIALIRQLFERVLPDLTRINPLPIGPILDWTKHFCDSPTNYNMRFTPVLKQSDSIAKSGPTIARFITRTFGFNQDWFIQPSEIQTCITNGLKVLFFIDDILGTGKQFSCFFNKISLIQDLSSVYCAYTPIVAHKKGISELQTTFPKLHVRSVEILDNSHSLFHKESKWFDDGTNNNESALEFYYKLLEEKKIDVNTDETRGFGCLELAYFFSHATPDNCLPILWWPNSLIFKPLFTR